MNFKNTSNEELLSLYKSKSQDMMYYQCAEGESWYRERIVRESCKAELAQVAEELKLREIPIPQSHYLL